MNYDDTKRLLEIQEANGKRLAQIADDLSFIRDRLGEPVPGDRPKQNEDDRPRRKEEPKVTIFNDDDILQDNENFDKKFSTESSFTTKSDKVVKPEFTAEDVYKMINVLLFIAMERENTFANMLKNYFGYEPSELNKPKINFIYDIIRGSKISEIDKALKSQTLNGDNLYKIYDNFK